MTVVSLHDTFFEKHSRSEQTSAYALMVWASLIGDRDRSFVNQLLSDIGIPYKIPVTKKKNGSFQFKMVKKFFDERYRSRILNLLAHSMAIPCPNPDIDQSEFDEWIRDKSEYAPIPILYYCVLNSGTDEQLARFLDYVQRNESDFVEIHDSIMRQYKDIETGVITEKTNLVDTNKKLKVAYSHQERRNNTLQRELYEQQIHQKKLKNELHKTKRETEELLQLAEAEIESLRKVVEDMEMSMHNQQEAYETYILKLIDNYERKIAQLTNSTDEPTLTTTPTLNGKKIFVFGDPSHQDGYRRIIEEYGGIFDFHDSTKGVVSARNGFQRSDAVILLTGYTRHVFTADLQSYVRGKPYAVRSVCGIVSFASAVEEIAHKLQLQN